MSAPDDTAWITASGASRPGYASTPPSEFPAPAAEESAFPAPAADSGNFVHHRTDGGAAHAPAAESDHVAPAPAVEPDQHRRPGVPGYFRHVPPAPRPEAQSAWTHRTVEDVTVSSGVHAEPSANGESFIDAEPVAAAPFNAEPFDNERFDAEPVAAEHIEAESFGDEPVATETFAAEQVEAESFEVEQEVASDFAPEVAPQEWVNEPVVDDSYTSVPVTSDSFAVEPLTAEPISADSNAAEPIVGERFVHTDEVTAAEPFVSEPFAAEPFSVDSYAAEPLAVDPGSDDSWAAEPFSAEPLAAEPAAAEPFAAEPIAAEPFVTEPVSAEPVAAEPIAAEPIAAEPTPVESALFTNQEAQPVEIGPTGRPRRVIPEPAQLSSHGPARVIAMCNQKGGVGKTTATLNLGAALAECGRRVLLVDLDPQGALSAGLGVPSHELERTIYNLMLERNTAITDVLVPTGVEGMDLLPANIDLSAAEVQLINEVGREHTLARALRPLVHAYDYVLIDCQPSLGLLTVNALACAHGVIMPVAAEFFSLRGVALLVDTIDKVKDRINPDLEIDGVLVTMFDGRTVHARDVVAMLVQRFGDEVYDTVIARTVKFPETTVAGEPITSYASNSAAAAAFRALAREVIAE